MNAKRENLMEIEGYITQCNLCVYKRKNPRDVQAADNLTPEERESRTIDGTLYKGVFFKFAPTSAEAIGKTAACYSTDVELMRVLAPHHRLRTPVRATAKLTVGVRQGINLDENNKPQRDDRFEAEVIAVNVVQASGRRAA